MRDDLAAAVAALEERVRRLETQERPAYLVPSASDPGAFWALEALKARAPDGGVVFAGSVTLPTGEHYEWQEGLPNEQLFDADWQEMATGIAATLTALGHSVRLLILTLVLTGTHAVADLQRNDALGTTGQLYHHLRTLVNTGWLRPTTRGHYAVPPDRIVPLLVILTAARR